MNKTVWGNLKLVIVQLAIYFTPVSWGMMFLTFWHTTASPQLREWGYDIPTWAVVLVGVCTAVVAGFIEYRYSTPSYYASQNKLMYNDKSPVMQRLEKIERLLEDKAREKV